MRRKGFAGVALICLIYWIIDSIWSYFSFEQNLKKLIFSEPTSIMDTLLLRVPPYQIVSRIMVVFLFILLGSLVVLYMKRKQIAENERKQAAALIEASLKEKETLLQEIHHRVKNNMNVISSLLKLHENSVEDDSAKNALRESQGRIYTMSAVHEALYNSERLSEVDLTAYLAKISETLIQTYTITPGKVNFITTGDNVKLNIDQASPLGLTVNELISNSLKYAFPDSTEGTISVTTNLLDRQIQLVVYDNGLGMPENLDWKNTNTLGLKLVRSLVENQLHGSIDMERNEGTKFTILFDINP